MPKQPYWIVWDETHGEQTRKHASLELATAEAERLATQNPGRTFAVLRVVTEVATCERPLKTINFESPKPPRKPDVEVLRKIRDAEERAKQIERSIWPVPMLPSPRWPMREPYFGDPPRHENPNYYMDVTEYQ